MTSTQFRAGASCICLERGYSCPLWGCVAHRGGQECPRSSRRVVLGEPFVGRPRGELRLVKGGFEAAGRVRPATGLLGNRRGGHGWLRGSGWRDPVEYLLPEAQFHRFLLEGHALRHVLGNGLPAAAEFLPRREAAPLADALGPVHRAYCQDRGIGDTEQPLTPALSPSEGERE